MPSLPNTEMHCSHEQESAGCGSLQNQRHGWAAFGQLACASFKYEDKGPAQQPGRQPSVSLTKRHFSPWLALRASVLRRAVSSTTRPALHCSSASVTVGRAEFQFSGLSAQICAHSKPKQIQMQKSKANAIAGWRVKAAVRKIKALWPNHSTRTPPWVKKAVGYSFGFLSKPAVWLVGIGVWD